MKNTKQFTSTCSMLSILIETFFMMWLSNLNSLLYFFMLVSMAFNAGLTAVIYPIAVFCFAMLEETRPRNWFWKFIMWYTTILLLIKFTFNLSIVALITVEPSYQYIEGALRIGLHDFSSTTAGAIYMLPEIIILVLLYTQEIFSRLNGVHF